MKHLISISLVTLLIFSSCRKPEACPEEFKLPSAWLYPYDSVYHIGDTINISSKFSKFVYEKNTESTYNMENIIWTAGLGAFRIDTGTVEDASNTNTKEYFEIVNCTDPNSYWFTYSGGATSLELTYKLENDSFNVAFSMIPKRKGILLIAFGGGVYESNQEFDGKCKNVTFSGGTPFNEGKDNNIYLLKKSPIEHYNTWILQKPEERFYEHRYFALRIID